ncbi:sugar phosphate isomerase/epimerase [Halogeometricum borinquense]|uniref:Sugar phosphate isomerase/epimerase n=1 Tax=Halogeometricum borinquense TaxID=60847 RepID=A0A482TV65_9EURY|nr:sugar phosphate isomerase/epimerase [Halogeometricum borinquense]RYJ19495.1 sugar phosphate isomerase/epimerase [Halogeometricum borinquense]
MAQIAIQLYSVHELDDDTATILEHVAETDLDGVEFFRLDEADDIADTLDRTDLGVAGVHVGLESLEDNFAETVDVWSQLGIETFVVPWADPKHFETHETIEALAERLSAIAAKLDQRGYSLHYHNHDHEFVTLDDEYALEILAENAPEVGLELDLGWAGAAGAEPLSLVESYADRIDLLHVKDYDTETGSPAKVGEGDLDLAGVASVVREYDIEWLIYEYEDAPDTYETVEHASESMSYFQ